MPDGRPMMQAQCTLSTVARTPPRAGRLTFRRRQVAHQHAVPLAAGLHAAARCRRRAALTTLTALLRCLPLPRAMHLELVQRRGRRHHLASGGVCGRVATAVTLCMYTHARNLVQARLSTPSISPGHPSCILLLWSFRADATQHTVSHSSAHQWPPSCRQLHCSAAWPRARCGWGPAAQPAAGGACAADEQACHGRPAKPVA
jgi:hypothetical protein